MDVNGKQHIGPPKTKAGVRTVTIPATIADLLGGRVASAACQRSGLVFPTVSGQPMRRANFRKVWRQAVQGSKERPGVFAGTELEGLVFHELRHTAAALAIEQGAHPMVIRDRLGHSSITVTLDVYGGLFPSTDETLADALDDVLRSSLALAHAEPGGQVVALGG